MSGKGAHSILHIDTMQYATVYTLNSALCVELNIIILQKW